MLESLVRNVAMEHMKNNPLLNSVQHGFVPGRSCSTQFLLADLDEWTSAMEHGDIIDALYMDSAKYPSTLSLTMHRLLVKLEGYGIGGYCAAVD